MNLKKPNFWDLENPNIFAYLLYPLSLLIKFLGIFFRISKPKTFGIKTICVGNMYVGGTGKTSLSLKINKILTQKKIKSCFVKKFYKNQIDEQKLLQRNGKLYMSSKRINAIKNAESAKYEVAIFDDGLQDRSIKYDLSIVCFNNINWIGNGMTIPAGPLRENITNLKKYDCLFLNGNLENVNNLKNKILDINPKIKIFLGKYEPTNLDDFDRNEKYIAFSGIGNHQTFIAMIKNFKFNILKEFEFPDHYNYKNEDIRKILIEAENLNCKIITTEKDYLRLDGKLLDKIKYIKSDLKIVDEENFIKFII